MRETPSHPPPHPEEVIKRGDKGERVEEWQSILAVDCDYGIAIDGAFGAETVYCTKLFQAWKNLPQTGIVDVVTWDAAADFVLSPKYKHRGAKNFTPAFRVRIDLIVIHTMEAPHKPDTAERVADWFNGPTAPKASAHYCVDQDSIVQCVRDNNIAWHAPGVNENSIGVEHAGYAKFSREEWLSDKNLEMLRMSARLVGDKCRKYSVPVRLLTAAEVKGRERGLTGHKQVTDAFSAGKGHWDPGPGWPWDVYLRLVNGEKV